MNTPKHINTADLDWTKPLRSLAAETGLSATTIRELSRVIFNAPRFTPKWEAKYGGLDWASVDWAKMNNQAVATLLGTSVAVARQYRNRNNLPACTKHRSCGWSGKVLTAEQISGIDWLNYCDSEIAETTGVTRERIRQLRFEHQKPQSRVHCMSETQRKVFRWLLENREKLEGQKAYEVQKAIPFHMMTPACRRVMRRTGINFDWSSGTEANIQRADHFNWALPNKILKQVWGATTVHSMRHNQRRQSPKWNIVGTNKDRFDPKFRKAVSAECDKAHALGQLTEAKRRAILKEWVEA